MGSGIKESNSEIGRIDYLRNKFGKLSSEELHQRINTPKLRRMLEDYSPSKKATEWQGEDPYFGIDAYTDKIYPKGSVLYAGEPFPTGYFTTKEALDNVGVDAHKVFEGLQVKPYWGKGMFNAIFRDKMVGYELKVDITGANGIAKNNTQFWRGRLEQIFMPDLKELIHNKYLKRLSGTEIKLTNTEMPFSEYKKIIEKIKALGGKGF
ncbi:hypothetical protein GCM10007968_15250 [Sporolactobacillus putidus]|uniref:Uncharacterized protein n=2 Tax=Sporolactobacillus putidus TaxID=492735 RepID=A0A917S3C3_9BACL|nr:hypothetical protein GCM10007968_15250 [Sporolactobacillus putidus]